MTNKEEIDERLQEIDDDQIAAGAPPLSVLVIHDDGAVSTAFMRTVEKHNLRLPGESDNQLVARFRDLAFRWASKQG